MLYAKQIAPEHQESPLFLCDDLFPDNIILNGNRQYNAHTTPEFDQIRQEIAEAAGESDPAAVVLYEFAGFTSYPEYRKAV